MKALFTLDNEVRATFKLVDANIHSIAGYASEHCSTRRAEGRNVRFVVDDEVLATFDLVDDNLESIARYAAEHCEASIRRGRQPREPVTANGQVHVLKRDLELALPSSRARKLLRRMQTVTKDIERVALLSIEAVDCGHPGLTPRLATSLFQQLGLPLPPRMSLTLTNAERAGLLIRLGHGLYGPSKAARAFAETGARTGAGGDAS